jgi:predicted small lipoprotein YifL
MLPRSHSRPGRRAVGVLALAGVLAACGTAGPLDTNEPLAAEPRDGSTQPEVATDAMEEGAAEEALTGVAEEVRTGVDVRVAGDATLEILGPDGTVTHGWTLHDATFHSFLVRPGATADHLDVVAVALQGERPVLHHASVRAGSATLAALPDHLQPTHVVDASPPAIAWTPDALSLVWTETTGEDLVLRTVGWDDGPGTGRHTDDNASFLLDLPPDAHVDGFEVHDDGVWTLLLRDGTAAPHEVGMERQRDGALALPPA